MATISDGHPLSKSKLKKRKYVPGLAAFYFEPTDDWSKEDAERLYHNSKFSLPFEVDTVVYIDCIEGMKQLPSESIDLIIADPPFGIEFNNKERLYNRDSNLVIEKYHEVEENYYSFTERWINQLPRIMKKTATVYIFSGWTHLESILTAARKAGLYLLNHLIWTYQFGVFTKRKYVTSHYHILMYVKDLNSYYFNKIEHYPKDSFGLKRKYARGKKKNATKLPTELVQKLIDFSSKPGYLVLDPFMGNGTTAVAAKGSYRHFLGFEINLELKDIIEKNIKQMPLGGLYREYKTLKPSIEELKKKYPKAYKIYKAELEEKKKCEQDEQS